ncbi:hypothetical protein LSCM1_01282 [Leishmania martiniquensis]|uniref:Uncharacterized protein n=1 Tax=Leishmania martiniquensis TaxID=1580590 RepID=A0A836G394_9TRYP|nr:hypothetical protein LSCM1_01282 [Leishmania martiniquensis]
MAGTFTASSEELRRTRRYLAEVIDECVFVERQRDLTERRLSSQLETQRALVDELFAVLRDMCQYTFVMEDAILPALRRTLPASSPAHQKLLELRVRMRDALMRLRECCGTGGDEEAFIPATPRASSCAKAAVVPVVLPAAETDAGSEVIRRLFEREARLLEALDRATVRIEATRAGTRTEQSEVEALRARIDELSHLVGSGTIRSLKTAPAASAPPGLTAAAQAHLDASPSTAHFADAQLRAYEKTVQALNSELSLLHENYSALSHARTREADMMKQHMADTQRKHEDQIAECDAVLGRISLELEQLIQENAQLKHKLRMVSARQ